MTKITLLCDDNDVLYGFEAEGHSGFARSGKDIVCASISVLTINFVNSIDELTSAKCNVLSDEKSGYMHVTVDDYNNRDVQLLFSSLKLGLNEIQQAYSRYLKLTNRRCKP